VQPLSNNPAVFMPPSAGASIMFERVDCYLDGVDILKDVDVSNLQFVYQHYNRMFSTYSQRARLGQDSTITCSDDMDDLRTKSERLKKAMRPLQSVTWESATTLLLTFGFDGIPFCSAPRCLALATLQSCYENSNLALPPGSCLEITLHKRDPLTTGFEWPAISTGTYFSNTAATDEMKDLEITIESAGLCYESTVMAESQRISRELKNNLLSCYFDIPRITFQALLSKQQSLNMTCLVPAGSRCAYFSIVYGHQLWPADKKPISARTKFPTSLRRMSFSIAGHETIASKRGFEQIGGDRGFSSESCRAYFNQLRETGVIDAELEEMFPREGSKSSFIQVFFLDLRPYRIMNNTTMFIEMEFSSNLSPERCNLLSIFMREMCLYKARGTWHTKFTDSGN
jgi:hypothetical protein